MRETKKPNGEKKIDQSCPWWIFGNKDSAKRDLNKFFEIKNKTNEKEDKYNK